ncbi:MAG: hypothetical protein LUG17_05860, partial [Clostridiales bacterium]|nr:hypothetical protein [Clostridiales bacterium]
MIEPTATGRKRLVPIKAGRSCGVTMFESGLAIGQVLKNSDIVEIFKCGRLKHCNLSMIPQKGAQN